MGGCSLTIASMQTSGQTGTRMIRDWKQWEGQTVNGTFLLRQYLGGSAPQRGFPDGTPRTGAAASRHQTHSGGSGHRWSSTFTLGSDCEVVPSPLVAAVAIGQLPAGQSRPPLCGDGVRRGQPGADSSPPRAHSGGSTRPAGTCPGRVDLYSWQGAGSQPAEAVECPGGAGSVETLER